MIGDMTRLRQILTNLLNNGIKFTDAGEVTLQANLSAVDEKQSDGGLTLHFVVRDTGIGIAADKRRLFSKRLPRPMGLPLANSAAPG